MEACYVFEQWVIFDIGQAVLVFSYVFYQNMKQFFASL